MTADQIKAILNGLRTKTAGRLRLTEWDDDFVELCPDNRERADNYYAPSDWHGPDGDAWGDCYEQPLYAEVVAALKDAGIEAGWRGPVRVEVDEKGYVNIDF